MAKRKSAAKKRAYGLPPAGHAIRAKHDAALGEKLRERLELAARHENCAGAAEALYAVASVSGKLRNDRLDAHQSMPADGRATAIRLLLRACKVR